MTEEWSRKIATNTIPGPKSKEILKRKVDCVPDGISIAHEIIADKAYGPYIKDVDGNIFIDFAGGIAVINAGHSNPKILDAMKRQVDRFTHTQAYKVPYEKYIELAEKIISISPIKGENKKCYFANSGAEAVENAIRVARHHKNAPRIIRFTNSFHGRTSLTMGLTANSTYKKGAFPEDSYVDIAPFPDPNEFPGTERECIEYSIDYLEYLVETECSPEETAAVIIEPVQGEGGYLEAPQKFMNHLRDVCDRHEIALITDEVQSGVGRTGKFWASEHYDVEPDIITFGKSIANGLPLSGIVGRKKILDSVHPGGIGGTYGGNPVACSAALATIDEINENLDHAQMMGQLMRDHLERLKKRFDLIDELRGIGPMIGIVLRDQEGEALPDATEEVIDRSREKGLLLLKSGIKGNVIRICGPILMTTSEIIEEAMSILEEALEKVST